MQAIGIRELKQRATHILRRVREKGETIQVTYRGQVVALLIPAPAPKPAKEKQTGAVWTDLDRLAAEIAARWPAGVSAAEAVSEGRRAL